MTSNIWLLNFWAAGSLAVFDSGTFRNVYGQTTRKACQWDFLAPLGPKCLSGKENFMMGERRQKGFSDGECEQNRESRQKIVGA
jgi:hypothetical protein